MTVATTDTARPRLFLIDGYSNIFRAFYAIRNLSSSKGEPTNAVYGFITMLRKLLREGRGIDEVEGRRRLGGAASFDARARDGDLLLEPPFLLQLVLCRGRFLPGRLGLLRAGH